MIRQEEIKALKEILSENKDSEIKIARSFLEDIVDYFEPKGIIIDKEFAEYVKKNIFLTTVDKKPKIGEWIPCSERLPEEKTNPVTNDFYEYQVTYKSEDVTDVRHYKFGRGHWWHGAGIMDEYVIAWQPLPEPYKP